MTSPQHSSHSSQRYAVIPRVLIFPEFDGKILLLKGSPTKPLWPNLYNGIGGHVEAGETIQQAAVRELEEETGITNVALSLCGMVNINLRGSNPDVMLLVFTCIVDSPSVRPSPEGDLEWYPWDALPTDNLLPDLPVLLPRIRQTRNTGQPFYALYTYNPDGSLQITFTD